MKSAKFLWIAALLLIAIPVASAADSENADFFISPWRLGMTRAQVVAEKEFGPYKPVQVTGGVETFDAQFDGKKTNVSFVFDDVGTLSYIQVWKYEGPEFDKALKAPEDVFDLFTNRFAGARIFGVNDSKVLGKGEFKATVIALLGRAPTAFSKLQGEQGIASTMTLDLMPNEQPANSMLHSQLIYSSRFESYYIFLYQDLPNAPSRQAGAMINTERY